MANRASRPPSDFAAQLIAAIEDAQAAASQQKPATQLAQAAWDKLQYDFPIISRDELAALVSEYVSGKRRRITARFLAVLRENAGAGAPGSDAGQPGEPGNSASGAAAGSGEVLVPLYQQLYAVAVVQSLSACLEAPEAAAAQQLADLRVGGADQRATLGNSHLEQMLTAGMAAADAAQHAEQPIDAGQQRSARGDDDGVAYEPIDAAPQPPPSTLQHQQGVQGDASADGGERAAGSSVPLQLAELAGHLSYQSMAEAEAWRALRLMQRLAGCLAAARRHPRFLELEGVVHPLLRLATDRMAAAPAELEAGLAALLDALGVPGGSMPSSSSGASKQDAAAAAAAAELAFAAAAALAAQVAAPAARRQLWQVVQERLLPLAGQQLEAQQVALARQARDAAGQPSPQQLYRIALPCQLVYFYVLQAPVAALQPGPGGAASRVHDKLLRGGLLRALVLLFVQLGPQPGAEPLRCVLLLACAAAQPLVDWAAAVPGFDAAAAAPALQQGGEAQVHGALWGVLRGVGGTQLAALLDDALTASKVPAVFQALQLMADMQAVSQRPQPLWDAAVDAALRRLAATLRERYSKPRQEGEAEQAAAAGSWSSSSQSEADDAADARKLAVDPQEQAELLAMRRAQQLQPSCLKLVKDLLHRHSGGGGKHD